MIKRVTALTLVAILASGTAATADPIPTDSLVLHLKPETLSALSDGDSVTNWPDSSVAGNDSQQATAADQPTFKTNILNGYGVVRFVYSNSEFLTNTAPTTFAEGTEFSAFAVVGNVGAGQHQVIFGGRGGIGTLYGRANGGFRIQSESATDASGHSDMTAAFQIRSFARTNTGNIVSAYLNGTLDDTPGAVAGTFDLHAVGARLINPLYLDGDIAEVLIYSSELGEDDRQLVEGSLAWKYGLDGNLPEDHPHKTVNPNLTGLNVADTSVAEGDSGTTAMLFDVSLSAITAAVVTVQFTTSNGTATAGSDYVATNGTLSFTAAGTNQVTVLVNGDTTAELDKTLFFILSNPSNAVIQSGAVVQGTIVDDDPFPPTGSAIPTNDLVLWLRPGTLDLELTNTQEVASWRDCTIPREDTRNSGSSLPTLRTNILNGYSAVRFGGSQYLTNTASTTFADETEFSAFAVVGNVGAGAQQPIFGGSPESSYGTIYGRANGGFRIQSENGVDSTGHSDMTAAFQIRSFARTNTVNTVSAYLDGTLDDTPSAVAGIFDLHTVGARLGAGPLYLDGDIVEVLIYSSELSTNDRQLVEGSLAWKYGLEGNLPELHPYASINPNTGPAAGAVIIIR